MGLLATWDAHNQRVADRQRAKGVPDESGDEGAVIAVSSYASCLPGIAGLLGVLALFVVAISRHRKR